MSMEIKGRCIQVLPVETGMGSKGQWKKMSFILETKGQYPKKVCLQLWGDKVDNRPAVGDELTCAIDPESREYNGRWYTDLRVWKIEGFTGNLNREPLKGGPASGDEVFDTPSSSGGVSSTDDLPFSPYGLHPLL